MFQGGRVARRWDLFRKGLAAETPNPIFFEVDQKCRLLFSVNAIDTSDGGPGGAIRAFALGERSDEQREFRSVLRQFCEDKIAPGAARRDQTGEYEADPDPRPMPELPFRLAHEHRSGEGS